MFGFKCFGIAFEYSNPNLSGPFMPVNSVIFSQTNLSNYGNKNTWDFIDMSQSDDAPSIIKSVSLSNSGLKNKSVSTISKSTSENGSHISLDILYSPIISGGAATNGYTNAGGSHSHIVSYSLKETYPLSLPVYCYQLNKITTELPKNSIVFSVDQQVSNDYDLISSNYEDCFLISGNNIWLSTQTTTYGANTPQVYGSATSGGSHNHAEVSPYYTRGSTALNTSTYNELIDWVATRFSGSHSHPGGPRFDLTLELNRSKLKTYISNKNTGLLYGMIIGYNRNVAPSPPFYICDGSTISSTSRGSYTTPSLTNKYLQCTRNTSIIPITSSSNICRYDMSVISDNVFHGHDVTKYKTKYNFTTGMQHGNGEQWAHTHAASGSASYEPSYYGLSFMIYLP